MSDKAKLISWRKVYASDHVKIYDDGPDFVGAWATGEIDGRKFWMTLPMSKAMLDDYSEPMLENIVRGEVENATLETIGP